MAITPIDVKTNIAANNESSRLRENQKAQELGQTQLLVQNQEKIQEKFETVHQTEATESRILRKEDEEAESKEKEKKQSQFQAKKPEPSTSNNEHIPNIPDPEGIRGLKIDIKA